MSKAKYEFSTPFKEEDFYNPGETFEEHGRQLWQVDTIKEGSMWLLTLPIPKEGVILSTDYSLEDVSERDRPYVGVGSILEEVYGRRRSASGSVSRVSFWVVKSWPKDIQ